ncbi:hypothetical protein DQ04_05471050 [Trypanosoma grayi]|uniref:hypothetical protein n=1 Tax=Trypanosoma grayi TaxID=71804 RepID=UPI0004F41D15|nr:hypothetical protein DQ04_05471050 [Trypanosoma grayi]KEG09291.1 hypothetical protein DQ04_05471050 [Trypanosoma grayi]
MTGSEEVAVLPEALRRITALSIMDCPAPRDFGVHIEVEQGQYLASASTTDLIELIGAIRQQYMQLVAEACTARDCSTTADISKVHEKLEALSLPIVELQKGIRSKTAQTVRVALRVYLANEVEARRRALSRMKAALSIAKQTV